MHGLWINNNNIWIQCILFKVKLCPIYFNEYSFIDENNNNNQNNQKSLDKYDKMLKMGVPKEAVERQKIIRQKYTTSPPPPNFPINKSTNHIPKIKAEDLQNVVLKKSKKNK